MEREALIDIILNDLNEMHTLVSTFKGKTAVNPAFINLAKTKLNNISEELSLLESVQESDQPVEIPTESSLTSSVRTITPEKEADEIAESSEQFVSGEASSATTDVNEVITEVEVKKIEVEKNIDPKKEEKPSTSVQEKSEPVIEAAPEEQNEKPEEKKSSVLGEKMHSETKSVNEQIAVKKEGNHISQIGKPVDDVRKAIGINDRFYYQRELFDGNMEKLNQTLDQLNTMDSFDSARQFLKSNFNWDDDNEVSQSFIKNIQRRFI
ncbi:hypothetical protein [Carboxylicivirga linearis]|uniref:Uncharacterized protein n=1 Tax=Carboxylicivirga linearis TaxID=1628157 RepID=A0ABS5JSX1_9BACT|nr:hypothetical protein [Carboxylicivirga linearis]MBS2097990.1 hypothetical protein [Carboxylicivirga linearis]